MKTSCLTHLSLVVLLSSTGCMTGPTIFERTDEYSTHMPGTDQWWAEKAMLPPGVRQTCWKGKVWPVQPRSTQERQQFTHTFHSAHYWPLPYVCADRQYVRDVFAQQEMRGWREETTLWDRFFTGDEQRLTRAGQLHLDRILHLIPPERRTVYIQSTYDDAQDQMRRAEVESWIAQSPVDSQVPVVIRTAGEVSRAAAEVGRINEQYINSIPAPRLGGNSTGGGGGGGGGGGAAPSGP